VVKKLYLYYLLVLIPFSFSNCKKDGANSDNPYGLPNATQKGLRVFACRINGFSRIAGSGSFSINGYVTSDSVAVAGEFGDANYFERVGFIVYGNVKINFPYSLTDSIQTKFLYGTDSTCFGVSSNLTFVDYAFGSVTFTRLDSTNRVISGTFSFKAPVPGCDTLNFTDGRFDVGY
jgi:hypothetical protein